MNITSEEMERLENEFDLENYQPLSVIWHLRSAILTRLRNGEDVLPDIDGRQETKSDLMRAVLSGSHPYLISEEGTGKTRLARSLSRLLPPVPAIKGCAYHDDPKWENYYLCNRCQDAKNPVEKYGIEFIPGELRFSRVQGNEYTNEAKILGLKDIQAIAQGKIEDNPAETFGAYGWCRVPDLQRLYRDVLLRYFPHHVAITQAHVGNVLWEALGNYLEMDVYHCTQETPGLYTPNTPF